MEGLRDFQKPLTNNVKEEPGNHQSDECLTEYGGDTPAPMIRGIQRHNFF